MNTLNTIFKTCLSHVGYKSNFVSRQVSTTTHRNVSCYIAVGSNMGNRYQNIIQGIHTLQEMSSQTVKIKNTSFLYETSPMYITEQSPFLNGMIEIETQASPMELISLCKRVEVLIGRDIHSTYRNGPRPLDLDIIYYDIQSPTSHDSNNNNNNMNHTNAKRNGGIQFQSLQLTIPHPKIQERDFVLFPLNDLDPLLIHPLFHQSSSDMMISYLQSTATKDLENCTKTNPRPIQILPLPHGRILHLDQPKIMGILNVTPDSFSDGGKFHESIDMALHQALQLVQDGADIIDLGGESTRPGSKETPPDIQLQRILPVMERIRHILPDIPISIDTRSAIVAQKAIEAGGDIINDVSGGTFDPNMLSTVARLGIPIVLMHMRGTPETMQHMTQYKHVIQDVSMDLKTLSHTAQQGYGIFPWLQILDPGIGFAKTMDQNLSILKNIHKMNHFIGPSFPLLLGPSRKGFIGKITGVENPEERDYGTITACILASLRLNGSPMIARVHNVRALKHAYRIMEAIEKAQ